MRFKQCQHINLQVLKKSHKSMHVWAKPAQIDKLIILVGL
jgi:hypothetical protein